MTTYERLLDHLEKWESELIERWDNDTYRWRRPTGQERTEEALRWLCKLWDLHDPSMSNYDSSR